MVKVQYSNNKKHFGISMFGHANYAESGKDIVCAGISVIGSAFIRYGERLQADRSIKHLTFQIKPGNVVLSFDYKRRYHDIVQIGITSLLDLLNDLSLEYPCNIHVEEIEHGNICA